MVLEPQQQRLERLGRAEDADVRCRRRRQQAAQDVARFRADAQPVGRLRIRFASGKLLAQVLLHAFEPGPVRLEAGVHRRDEALAQTWRCDLRGDVVAPAAISLFLVVGDVAGRLFEVGEQPAPLKDLREDVGRVLHRDVHAYQLRDGVVAVLHQHPLVQLLGAPDAHRLDSELFDRGRWRDQPTLVELIEEQTAKRLGRARVTGEERPLHDVRKIREGEDRPIDAGEMAAQDVAFLRGEFRVQRSHEELTCRTLPGGCEVILSRRDPRASKRRSSDLPLRSGRRSPSRALSAGTSVTSL